MAERSDDAAAARAMALAVWQLSKLTRLAPQAVKRDLCFGQIRHLPDENEKKNQTVFETQSPFLFLMALG